MFRPRARKWALPALTFILAAPAVAQDSLRILDPQSLSGAGSGWSVDPASGRLGLAFPLGVVPGEIPIALPFHFTASHSKEERMVRVLDPDWDPVLDSKQNRWMSIPIIYDRPIRGGVDFGFIKTAAVYSGYTESATYALEDGRQFRDRDLVSTYNPSGVTLDAPAQFGLTARTWTQVRTHVGATIIVYDATAAQLGSWATKAASLAPTGFTATTGYKVVMDKDRARVYALLPEMGRWMPILWLDRFGHAVSFQWKKGAASGFAVYSVKILNHRNLGLQVQWGVPSLSAAETENILLRADFIGIQAPSLQVWGYSGTTRTRPAALGGVADYTISTGGSPPLRPTRLRSDIPTAPTLPAPPWIAGGLPIPAATGTDDWGAALEWGFAYDAVHAELARFTDPMGLTTTFGYQNQMLSGGSANGNELRAVSTANSVDGATGLALNRSWTRIVPGYNAATTTWSNLWRTSLTQSFSSGDTTEIPTQEWTFAGPDQAPHYGNGALLFDRLYSGTTNWRSQNHVLGVSGVDGSLSKSRYLSINVNGQPTQGITIERDSLTGAPVNETLKVGGVVQRVTAYRYEPKPGFLDPSRLSQVNNNLVGEFTTFARRFTYDAKGLPTQDYVEYIDFGGTAIITLQRGQSFTYDAEGHLKTVASFPAGTPSATTTYTPGPNGLPESATTTFSSPNGGSTSFSQGWTYNPAGRVLTATDGRGVTTTTTFDARGRTLSVATSGSATTTLTYPTEFQRTWSSTAGSALTGSETTDGFGRRVASSRPGGFTETPTFDVLGRVTVQTETNGAGISRKAYATYDPLGRTLTAASTTSVLAQILTTFAADGASSKVTTTLSNGVASSVWTNPQGQTVKTSDPWSTVTTTYNNLDLPTEVKQVADGVTQTRSFSYNGLGDLTSRTEPETGTATFSGFDSLGNPTSINDGVRTRTLAFDGLGRLRSVTSGTESLSTVYNGLLLASSSTVSNDQTVGQTYAYGLASAGAKLASETSTLNGVVQTTGYGYDGLGRLDTLTYPSGRKATYGFDTQSRINLVSQIPSGGVAVKIADVTFDAWGNRNKLAFASNAKSEWLADLQGASLQAWTVTPYAAAAEVNGYANDTNGNLKKGGGWSTLTHDTAGRLTAATGFGVTETLAHDGFGNNTSSVTAPLPTGSNNYTFATMPNNKVPALTSTPTQASTGWVYQGNGEATQIGAYTGNAAPTLGLQWDGLGRMASATSAGATWKNTYAPSGMRVQLTDSATPGNSRKYAYTSGGILLGEYTTANVLKREVIYLGSEAIAEIDGAGTHELHNDHLGSPRVITAGTTGAVEGRQVFGPYGEKLPDFTVGYQPITGYTGHVHQDPSGLIYMRGRFFTPSWHRFVNSDQGVDPNSWNQMAYVGGSPFQATDPSGMMWAIGGANCYTNTTTYTDRGTGAIVGQTTTSLGCNLNWVWVPDGRENRDSANPKVKTDCLQAAAAKRQQAVNTAWNSFKLSKSNLSVNWGKAWSSDPVMDVAKIGGGGLSAYAVGASFGRIPVTTILSPSVGVTSVTGAGVAGAGVAAFGVGWTLGGMVSRPWEDYKNQSFGLETQRDLSISDADLQYQRDAQKCK